MRRVMLIHHCSIEMSSPSHQSPIQVIVSLSLSLDLVEADRFGHTPVAKADIITILAPQRSCGPGTYISITLHLSHQSTC